MDWKALGYGALGAALILFVNELSGKNGGPTIGSLAPSFTGA